MPTFRSFAKINWHLEIVGRRPDGYHELRTIYQTIDWGDELAIDVVAGEGVEIEVQGAVIPAKKNLAFLAAADYLRTWGRPGEGVRIELRKRVPAGGGLGAGSSNAATVLLALDSLLHRASPEWREAAAAALGADVPFFLAGGLALGLARGDRIRRLHDAQLPQRELWLALPGTGLSTPAVFAALDPPREPPEPGAPIRAAVAGERLPEPAAVTYRNDLEPPAFALSPATAAVYTSLQRSGARLVRMSGSGSTVFACFGDPGAAHAAAANLPPGTIWRKVRTLGRAEWRLAGGFGSSDEDGGD